MEMIYRLSTSSDALSRIDDSIVPLTFQWGSIKYTAQIFTVRDSKREIWPLGHVFNGTEFEHFINVKYCGPKGTPDACTDNIADIAIGFYVINDSLDNIREKLLQEFTQGSESEWEVITVDGRKGFSYVLGAEGINDYHYFLQLSDERTLAIVRKAIDEKGLPDFTEVPDFIPFSEQEDLFFEMLQSISFRDSTRYIVPKSIYR